MEYIATHDIQNFLYSISIKYNIDLDVLRDIYLPIINIEIKIYKIKQFNNVKTSFLILNYHLNGCWINVSNYFYYN